jgi:hypothetical protein
LEEVSGNTPLDPHGPIFTRWLPNGRAEAIVLNHDANTKLELWFERRGYVESHGFIVFDYERREVDEGVMSRQLLLDAGPLGGVLELRNLNDAQLTAVTENKQDDAAYIALGKKVIMLISQPIRRMLTILRTNYGQYWIHPLEPWDYQEGSIGAYCARLGLSWSIDEEKWHLFRPNIAAFTFGWRASDLRDYLQESDWMELKSLCETGFFRQTPRNCSAEAMNFSTKATCGLRS